MLFFEENKLIHMPNPPENVTTLTCELQNFFVKHFHLTKGMLRSFKCWRQWKKPVVGCHRWLWKEPVVMCGNWNVSKHSEHLMWHQVFRVTTFCISTCFRSFLTLIIRTVHHAVLKFSPCCNKPLQQAATCPYQYARSSCSVPQTQY